MSDWKDIVKAVAPSVAGLLGGPLAATAVRALSQSVLGKPDGDEQELAAVVASGNPEVLARIKEAEASLKTALANAGVQMEAVHAGDRDSARKLAISTTLVPQITLSVLFVVGYLALCWTLLSKQIAIAESMSDIFMVLVGVLTAGVTQILNFWLGTSAGSKSKDAILDRVVNHK